MEAFRRIVFVAAIAGLAAGLFVTAIHLVGTVPLILQAETYETAAAAEAAAATDHEPAADAWGPQDGFERTAYTLLADIVTGIGFALLLVAAYALRGQEMDWRKGLYWGLAGFATFTLAPGLGLSPDLPGTESAPLLDRQIWWVATAIATGAGLALVFFSRRAVWALAGVALMAIPHIYGAPQPAEYKSLAPESIEHDFVVAVVVTSLLFWAVLGSLTGLLYKRYGQPA